MVTERGAVIAQPLFTAAAEVGCASTPQVERRHPLVVIVTQLETTTEGAEGGLGVVRAQAQQAHQTVPQRLLGLQIARTLGVMCAQDGYPDLSGRFNTIAHALRPEDPDLRDDIDAALGLPSWIDLRGEEGE